jgi:hypothetical protein
MSVEMVVELKVSKTSWDQRRGYMWQTSDQIFTWKWNINSTQNTTPILLSHTRGLRSQQTVVVDCILTNKRLTLYFYPLLKPYFSTSFFQVVPRKQHPPINHSLALPFLSHDRTKSHPYPSQLIPFTKQTNPTPWALKDRSS